MTGPLAWRILPIMIALHANGRYYLALSEPRSIIYSIPLTATAAWILSGRLGIPINAEAIAEDIDS